jgi:hypothetical protein
MSNKLPACRVIALDSFDKLPACRTSLGKPTFPTCRRAIRATTNENILLPDFRSLSLLLIAPSNQING